MRTHIVKGNTHTVRMNKTSEHRKLVGEWKARVHKEQESEFRGSMTSSTAYYIDKEESQMQKRLL